GFQLLGRAVHRLFAFQRIAGPDEPDLEALALRIEGIGRDDDLPEQGAAHANGATDLAVAGAFTLAVEPGRTGPLVRHRSSPLAPGELSLVILAFRATGINSSSRCRMPRTVSSKAASFTSSVPSTAAGSVKLQWMRSGAPGKTGHSSAALSQTVIT